MGLEEWLQSGSWASYEVPNLTEKAGRALEKLGGFWYRGSERARAAKTVGRKRVREKYQAVSERYDLDERVEAAKERAGVARERAGAAAERALRFVRERPTARIARAGIQIKAALTGFGAGYLLPDVEVLFLGVGGRGRWLVQSGVPVWGAERLARYLLLEAPEGETADRASSRWALRKELYGIVAAPLLTGLSAGLGLRLVQDALSVRGLPDVGRIIIGGREAVWERAWMLGNGVWCFLMGRDLLMVTLGRARSETITDMLHKLREEENSKEGGA